MIASSVMTFIAEVGDIRRFRDPKEIQKLAGLSIIETAQANIKENRQSATEAGNDCDMHCMNWQYH